MDKRFADTVRDFPAFLLDGGETGAELRAYDFAASPLGPPEGWPEALKVTLATMLSSPQPMFLSWGREMLFFFNDPYRPFLGARGAGALGRPFPELWPDIWAEIEPIVRKALAGEGSRFENMPLVMTRNGYPEETWWSFSYMPLRDGNGTVRGMLCVTSDSSAEVVARRTDAEERERLERMFQEAPSFMAMLRGPQHVVESANPAFLRLVGPRDLTGRTMAQALPDAAAQGYVALMDEVYRTGRAYTAAGARYAVQSEPDGPVRERYMDFVYQPIVDGEGVVGGIFVEGSDVTERVEAELASRDSEAFLRSVLASSGDCIKVLDLDARLVFMSEGGQRVMEVTDFDTIRGRPWPDFWHGRGNLDAEAAIAEAKAGGIGRFQGFADTMAGNSRFWDVQVTPILGADGTPERILAVSRDVTAAHEAEKVLRDALALNTLILDSSRDCIVVLDLDGHTLFVSPGGVEAMDIGDVDAILGLSWLRVWTGKDNDAAVKAVAEARSGGVGRFQGYCPTHKGTPKWWDVAISPLPGSDGRPERLVSIGRDITLSRNAEKLLAESQERLSLALGAAGMIGTWDWDLKEGLIYADANFARIYTVDPEWAARGAPLAEYVKNFHPADIPLFEAELARIFDGAPEFSCEYRILQPDGSVRWLLARGKLVRDAEGVAQRFSGASVEITDRKIAEEQRLELMREMSHRMKNMLSMVQAITTQTFRQMSSVEEGRASISGRVAALSRAQDILTATPSSTADIGEVVDNALAPHQTADKRIGFAGPAADLTGQQSLGLSLVLHELATNAAKYGSLSNDEGRVAIRWDVSREGAFTFDWVERGGPAVTPPARTGFGSKLIERTVAPYFEGAATLDFPAAGAEFHLTGTLSHPAASRKTIS